jgi:hypothetical protein
MTGAVTVSHAPGAVNSSGSTLTETSRSFLNRAVNSPGGATSAGGNLVSTSSMANGDVKGAATALYDALNKLEISTIKIEADPRDAAPDSLTTRFLGPGSPWGLAAKDPTSVIFLVGTNPMFDLAGWKKRKK